MKNPLFVLFLAFLIQHRLIKLLIQMVLVMDSLLSIVNPYEFESEEYINFVQEYGIHSSMGNDGEELIYLSAENNHHHHNEIKELDVNTINTWNYSKTASFL